MIMIFDFVNVCFNNNDKNSEKEKNVSYIYRRVKGERVKNKNVLKRK